MANYSVGNYETQHFDAHPSTEITFREVLSAGTDPHSAEKAAKAVDAACGILKKSDAHGHMVDSDFESLLGFIDQAFAALEPHEESYGHFLDSIVARAVSLIDVDSMSHEDSPEDAELEDAMFADEYYVDGNERDTA